MKALVGAQVGALVGAFSMIVNLREGSFAALVISDHTCNQSPHCGDGAQVGAGPDPAPRLQCAVSMVFVTLSGPMHIFSPHILIFCINNGHTFTHKYMRHLLCIMGTL